MFKSLTLLILSFCTVPTCSSADFVKYNHKPLQERVGIAPYARVLDEKEIKCLADNIYFEAGNQKEIGMKAVAFATLNRLKHDNFPDTICKIVYQKISQVCQFSWTCKKRKKIDDYYTYYRSKRMAKLMLVNYNYIYDVTKGATFFHRNDIMPQWANSKKRTAIIGRHLFYTL